jgi:HEAT repeat protein
MYFKLPHFDLFSFWFGFALATVFWLIILRISRLLPKMRKSMANNRERKSIEKSFTQEHEVLKYMQRKARSSHLASSVFSLDKILIEPKFLAPSLSTLTDEEKELIPSVYQVLPSMPETPEIFADLPCMSLALLPVLHNYQYLSISAPSGYGKTTALAYLTNALIEDGKDASPLPLFFDIRQLDQTAESVLATISAALAREMVGQSIETLYRIIKAAEAQKRVVFLLDGLDEFDQPAFELTIKWIKQVQNEFPYAKIVLTCSPYYNGSLESANFEIFTLAPWGQKERKQSLSLWKRALQDHFRTLPQDQKIEGIERLERIGLWLSRNDRTLSTLEINLYHWLSFIGALEISKPISLYETYLNYRFPENSRADVLPALAKMALENSKKVISEQQITNLLASMNGIQEISTSGSTEDDQKTIDEKSPLGSRELIDALLASQILNHLSEDTFSFGHLEICSYLQLNEFLAKPVDKLASIIISPLNQVSLCLSEPDYLPANSLIRLLNENDSPLFRNLLLCSNWLKNATTISPMRGETLKRIAGLLQNPQIPAAIRFRAIASLTMAKDPSISALFNYLKNSPDDVTRQLCALGFGLLNDEKFVPTLKALADDASLAVQNMAVISLGRIWTQSSQDALVDVIFSGNETTRRIGCEILALHAPDGHQMLKEITETDNYLAKKAAIFGLLMIKEEWVKPILEKMSVDDTQWVVRDAAGFALDKFSSTYQFTPSPLKPILENPWTLAQAELYGIQLPASGFPNDLLEKILAQGEERDRIIALRYLLTQPNAKLNQWLFAQIKQPPSALTEEVVNALYLLGKRGVTFSAN